MTRSSRRLWTLAVAVRAARAASTARRAGDDGARASSTSPPAVPDLPPGPPGTQLAEGFVVPVGARLVGEVFPHPDPIQNRTTVAVLTVHDDPLRGVGRPGSTGSRRFSASRCPPAGSAPGRFETRLRPGRPVHRPGSPSRVHRAPTRCGCEASASGPNPKGGGTSIVAHLWQSQRGAELHLELNDLGAAVPPSSFPEEDLGAAPSGGPRRISRLRTPSICRPRGSTSASRATAPNRTSLFACPPTLESSGAAEHRASKTSPPSSPSLIPTAALVELGEQLDPTGPDVGLETVHIERTTIPHTGEPVWLAQRRCATPEAANARCGRAPMEEPSS